MKVTDILSWFTNINVVQNIHFQVCVNSPMCCDMKAVNSLVIVPAKASTNWCSWEVWSSVWGFTSSSRDLTKLSRVWAATDRKDCSFPCNTHTHTQTHTHNSIELKYNHITVHPGPSIQSHSHLLKLFSVTLPTYQHLPVCLPTVLHVKLFWIKSLEIFCFLLSSAFLSNTCCPA